MKILAIAPYISPVYGGTSKVVTDITQAISNFDVAIDLVTTNANGTNKLDIPLNVWITKNSYRIKYFDCWHQNDFVISLSLINWLFNHLFEYDLIHTHTIFAPLILFAQWICQLHHIPYISTPHGMLEPWALSYKAKKKFFYYQLIEKKSLIKANAIHALASPEAKNICSLGFNNSIVVIPNGIHEQELKKLSEPELFYHNFPQTKNKTLILFLGRIDPKKGLDLLAPAFAKAHQNFSNTHLIVAGPDSINFMSTAEKYFRDAGCRDAVTFTGMLKGDLKLAALAAANVYIAPSYSEGFSISVLEGMVSGLPCIITTGCNFPEAAVAKAAYVTNINADAIADALIFCLSNPEEAKATGDRAREFILENYTWDKIAAKMVKVYQAILNDQNLADCLSV